MIRAVRERLAGILHKLLPGNVAHRDLKDLSILSLHEIREEQRNKLMVWCTPCTTNKTLCIHLPYSKSTSIPLHALCGRMLFATCQPFSAAYPTSTLAKGFSLSGRILADGPFGVDEWNGLSQYYVFILGVSLHCRGASVTLDFPRAGLVSY